MPTLAPYPGTQAALRAIALLKAVSAAPPDRGLSDLARAVGLNKTTTYRLLTALESEGMVTRDVRSETYRMGPEAIALSARALRSNDLRSAAHDELDQLERETGESATLEVRAGNQVIILDEAQSHHLIGTAQSVGTRWPAHATSTGKVLLAALSEEEVKEAMGLRFPRYTAATITTLAALREELARVRARGHALAIEELEPGYAAVGAPVRDHSGQVVAAISVGGPTARIRRDRLPSLARLVRDVADRISGRLGWDGA